MHLGAALAELEAKGRGATLGATGSSMYDVRESIQALFVQTFKVRAGGPADAMSTASTEPAIYSSDSVLLPGLPAAPPGEHRVDGSGGG